MGRKRQNKKKPACISETEEREKIKESILKVFRARLTLPDQGGALVVGPSKQELHSDDQETKHATGTVPSGYSSDRSTSSMSGHETARRKKSSVKRRKHTRKSKQKAEKVEKEASTAVTKHMKVARGVTYAVGSGKEAVTDKGVSSMITHARITQQVGLLNTGKKSAAVTRVPLQVPEHVRKQTEEQFRKIVENNDNSVQPIADIDEVQSRILSQNSRGTRPVTPASVEMKPQNNSCSTVGSIPNYSPGDPVDRFTEVLMLKETVVSLMTSLKNVNKQMYPGRDCLTEATDELLKMMKQNAPRSATPTPVPVLNKITSSGSIQRKLTDQFPPEVSQGKENTLSNSRELQRQKDEGLPHNNQYPNHKLPGSFSFTDVNPFQPITQNTNKDRADCTNSRINSLQNYKNSRPQTDHNLKLLANVLNKLHKDSGRENFDTRNNRPEMLNTEKNPYHIGIEAIGKRENLVGNSGNVRSLQNKNWNNEMKTADNQPVYVLKKQRAPNNLQMLYESAKLLQRQHRDPREDIRNELFKEELDKIFASGKRPERKEDVFLGCGDKSQPKGEFGPVFNDDRNSTKAGTDIIRILEDKAKKQVDSVDVLCEPMEVDDKVMDQEAKTLLQINDRKRMEAEAIDRLRNQAGMEENFLSSGSNFLEFGQDSQSQGSSQCSHCSCTNSSRYSGSQRGDILSQVVAKETDYMPSFHGGYYRDQLNVQDLMYEQKNSKEIQVDANAMDILDYIDDHPENRPDLHHKVLQQQGSLVSDRHLLLKTDHLGRYEAVKPPELHSPYEPKLYPRHMY